MKSLHGLFRRDRTKGKSENEKEMMKGIKSKLCITRIGYDSEDRFPLDVNKEQANEGY